MKQLTINLFLNDNDLGDDLRLTLGNGAIEERGVMKRYDQKTEPFILISASDWNAFQSMVSKFKLREQFKELNICVGIVERENVVVRENVGFSAE